MKEALKRSLRRDRELFGNLAATLLRRPLLGILVITFFISGIYMVRQNSIKNYLPNAGGCDATDIAYERLISIIASLKAEITADLPSEKVVGLVWIEVELINSALQNLKTAEEECGTETGEARASLEHELTVADAARLAAIAKARVAPK